MSETQKKPDKRKFASLRRYPKTKFSKGRFIPQHPEKYIGDVNNIIYRSSWEKNFLQKLDINPAILQYSSEELVIPYIHPEDGRVHRYFPDFWVRAKDRNGKTKVMVIEIKPSTQTVLPKKQKRLTKRYLTEVLTYAINTAKWEAAKKYCTQKGWEFIVLTEKELGVF